MSRQKWKMPLWVPNPLDSIVLFLSEALIVASLAAAAIVIAVVSLWVF